MTNFEKIKQMSVEEMAKAIIEVAHIGIVPKAVFADFIRGKLSMEQAFVKWLESEAGNE